MYVVESSLNSTEPIMLLNYPIGFDSTDPGSPYIDGALFQKELLELDGAGYKRIQVWINCPGGNVYEGYNICNAILKSNTPVDTYVSGIAASMAGAVFMCGRKRTMTDYSSLMIHNPFDPTGAGDKKQLEALRSSLVTMIAAKCNISSDAVAYLCDRETWIGPSECLEKGFCTDIEVTKEINQKRMPIAASAVTKWIVAKEINSEGNSSKQIFNLSKSVMENTTTPAAKIGTSLLAAYLGLNVESTENSVLAEVKTRINTLIVDKTKADEEMDKLKASLAKAKADYDDLAKKFEAKEKEIQDAAAVATQAQAKLKKEADDAALASKTTAAKAMVDSYAGAGKRIKTEAVDKWVTTALAIGIDEAKALIEELPLNAKAASATEAVATGAVALKAGELPTNAMALQAGVNARLKKARA